MYAFIAPVTFIKGYNMKNARAKKQDKKDDIDKMLSRKEKRFVLLLAELLKANKKRTSALLAGALVGVALGELQQT